MGKIWDRKVDTFNRHPNRDKKEKMDLNLGFCEVHTGGISWGIVNMKVATTW